MHNTHTDSTVPQDDDRRRWRGETPIRDRCWLKTGISTFSLRDSNGRGDFSSSAICLRRIHKLINEAYLFHAMTITNTDIMID